MTQATDSGLWHGRNPPLGAGSETHLRYSFAANLVRDRMVLDVGCGPGEGTSLLGETAREVVAVDSSTVAARYGLRRYGRANNRISFVVASGESLPFRPEVFEAATLFEVIEHVESQELLLKEVKSVLAPSGRAILSTPNKAFSSPGLKSPLTFWHTREFYPSEFFGEVSRHFTLKETLGIATRHRRTRLDQGPVFPVLKLVDNLPGRANLAARRLMSSRLGYVLTDFVYGRTDPSKVWIERDDLSKAYCLITVCEKESGSA